VDKSSPSIFSSGEENIFPLASQARHVGGVDACKDENDNLADEIVFKDLHMACWGGRGVYVYKHEYDRPADVVYALRVDPTIVFIYIDSCRCGGRRGWVGGTQSGFIVGFNSLSFFDFLVAFEGERFDHSSFFRLV